LKAIKHLEIKKDHSIANIVKEILSSDNRMVYKLLSHKGLLSQAAFVCEHLLDRCSYIMLLLDPATVWMAKKAKLVCMPAISVASMLLSFQLFSLSWKLL
jgi:hypothetical protein